MTEISIKTIKEAIINCRCPGPMFCTIATIVETTHKRERTVLVAGLTIVILITL